MPLSVKAHLRFLTKRWTHIPHKDSLKRNHHIKIGRGIKDLTTYLKQQVSTDWPRWTILLLLTDASEMLAPKEGAGFVEVGGMTTYFVHIETETLTRAKAVVIQKGIECPKAAFIAGAPHLPLL